MIPGNNFIFCFPDIIFFPGIYFLTKYYSQNIIDKILFLYLFVDNIMKTFCRTTRPHQPPRWRRNTRHTRTTSTTPNRRPPELVAQHAGQRQAIQSGQTAGYHQSLPPWRNPWQIHQCVRAQCEQCKQCEQCGGETSAVAAVCVYGGQWSEQGNDWRWYVKSVCYMLVVLVIASTDNTMNMHARVTLNVECIRAGIFDVFIVCVNAMTDQY